MVSFIGGLNPSLPSMQFISKSICTYKVSDPPPSPWIKIGPKAPGFDYICVPVTIYDWAVCVSFCIPPALPTCSPASVARTPNPQKSTTKYKDLQSELHKF